VAGGGYDTIAGKGGLFTAVVFLVLGALPVGATLAGPADHSLAHLTIRWPG
jgi:hypothetical protein